MKVTRIVFAPVLAATLAFATAACQNTAEGVKKDAADTAERARQAAADAAHKAKDAASSVADAAQSAKEAGQAVAQGAKEMTQAVAAASQTLDVKASLLADSSIDAANINVDTDAKTRTVVLKGSVPTDEQKVAAEKLAASRAAGYKVVNRLVVAPKK